MDKKLMTKLTHLGDKIPAWEISNPKIAPIVMSAAYSFDEPDMLEAVCNNTKEAYEYGRVSNPTNDCLREILAGIDEGEAAQVYSSGMAAISMAIMTHVKTGDHIIANSIVFGGSYKLLSKELQDKWGVEVTFVNFMKEDIEPYFKPNTKLVYTETIANPTIIVTDLRKISQIAHKHNCLVIVDNTFATPVVCQPLTLGVDIVVYSATKFMNGHSDILAGAIVANKKSIIQAIHPVGHIYGPTMSPFDAWLLTRSLRTLELRVIQHSKNAMKLAEFCEGHKKVERILYPGLASAPDHKIASEIFNNGLYGGMLSIDLGSFERVKEFVRKLKLTQLVASLGCLTTTVSDTRTSHSGMSAEEREKAGIADGIIRVSAGLENIDDIITDFDTALNKL